MTNETTKGGNKMKKTNRDTIMTPATNGRGMEKNIFLVLSALLATALLGAGSAYATSGTLTIAPWFPQGNNFVFQCNPSFPATSYGWSFGDGQYLYGIFNQDVYHTYSEDGEYEVTCSASDGTRYEASILRISVGTPPLVPPSNGTSVSLDIAPYFPQGEYGENYVFECNAEGFTATSYDWDFGDGQKLYDQQTNDVWHTFLVTGQYQVDCTASDGITRVQQSKIIVRGGLPEEPTDVLNATISIASGFPQGNNFVFTCETEAFTAVSYTWYFGDGQKQTDMQTNNLWHTYDAAGTYTVECDAKDEMGTELAKGFLDVSTAD
jgi:PKD repeat protein